MITILLLLFCSQSVSGGRVRRAEVKNSDYGSCTVRITRYTEEKVQFVLLCPPEMKPLKPLNAQQFICGLMFEAEKPTSCGGSDSMKTPIPPTTLPPLEPLQ